MSLFDDHPHWVSTNCATLAERLDGTKVYPSSENETDTLHFGATLRHARSYGFDTPNASARLEAQTLLAAVAEVDARFPLVDARSQLLYRKRGLEQDVAQHSAEVVQLERSLVHEKELLKFAQLKLATLVADIAELDAGAKNER